MPNNISTEVENSLETINQVSRQLLSQLDGKIKHSEFSRLDNDSVNNNDPLESHLVSKDGVEPPTNSSTLTDEQLRHLVTKRTVLIEQLFNQYTQTQLSSQLVLINEMVSLDAQLTEKSQQHKQALTIHMLKIKQSKKITKLYKKY